LSSKKTFSSETANRYALALYELASENSELEIIEKNVYEILAIYNASKDLKNFIKNPTQSQMNFFY
jgi:F-type H+-transporting ATPase subunit delta